MRKTRFTIITLLLVGGLALGTAPSLYAQSGMGTIQGTLVDGGGRPVTGITVQAIDVLDPTRAFAASSDAAGVFTIANVPVGTYQVAPRTANTPWIVKDTSPLVDVKSGIKAGPRIVLVRMHELSPSQGGGGGENDSWKMVTMASALAAAGLGVINAVQIGSTNNDIDDLQGDVTQLSRTFRDHNDDFQAFLDDFHDFNNRFEVFNDNFDDFRDDFEDFRDDFEDFRDDFDDFYEDWDDFRKLSPFSRR
jgi:hypothetical protein